MSDSRSLKSGGRHEGVALESNIFFQNSVYPQGRNDGPLDFETCRASWGSNAGAKLILFQMHCTNMDIMFDP